MWCAWLAALLLIFLMIAATPRWPYSREWGYFPSMIIALILLVFIFLLFFGWMPYWGNYYWWGGW